MRHLPLVLILALFASDGALAQPAPGTTCHKGIFWPFVRERGDCLTDAEIRNGTTGNYQDPEGQFGAPAEGGESPAAQAAPAPAPAGSTPAAAQASVAAPAAPAQASDAAPTVCHKGILWPFVRARGDCLTDAEIRNGMTGNYQDPGGQFGAPAAAAQAPAAAPPPPAQASAPLAAPAAQASAPAPAACRKGILWPFVRERGDCLTDAEIRNGMTGTYQDPGGQLGAPVAAAPPPAAPAAPLSAPAQASAAAPAAQGAVATATVCRKGFLWPFWRERGDCLTDAEVENGMTGNYQDPEGRFGTSVAGVPAPAASVPAQAINAAPAQSAIATAVCRKGFFWPYFRETGDCLTDAEIRSGAAGAYRSPQGTPAAQAVNGLPSVDQGFGYVSGEGCRKGVLWPFAREPGDCLTDTEKRRGMTGFFGMPDAVAPTAVAAPGGGALTVYNPNAIGGGGLLEDRLLPPGSAN